jgi:hydrogenase/urease accessory protein HupE
VLNRGDESAPYVLDLSLRDPSDEVGVPGGLRVAGQYLTLGFWHIVPEGLDHILFVLGLFLLAARWKPLLWQVTAFTAAHTVTLALSTYGVVRLSPGIVEPLIALSIAYVAIENLFVQELKPWRVALVFAFGLLHGLGFAGVLAELGLPQEDRLAALLSFNVGVELGQLAVLGLAFLALGWWRNHPQYRRRVVLPLSLVIALMGLYWAVSRTFGTGA